MYTPKKTETRTFSDLLKDFATAYENQTTDPTSFEKTLTDLARVTATAVLKKVIDPTRHTNREDPTAILNTSDSKKTVYTYGDRDTAVDSGFSPALVALRRQMFTAFETLQKEGNDHVDHDDFMTPAVGLNLEDGLDLVNDAVIAILEECENQKTRDPGDPVDLTRQYETRRLKRKVYIKDPASLGGYETVETTPIQEVYKAIRRSIQNSRHVQLDPRNGYTYLEDLYTDPDGDSDPTVIYRRLPKFADIGGHAMDGDRDPDEPVLTRCVNSYGDRETVDNVDRIIDSLNLTDRQRQVLTYRLQGYGNKAIATRFGVSDVAVLKTVKQIRKKWSDVYGDPATETATK